MREKSRPGSFCSDGGHGGEEPVAATAIIGRRAGAGQQADILAGEIGGAQAGPVLAGIEQPVGAIFVIRGRQQLAEFAKELRLEALGEVVLAPGVARERSRALELAVARQRPRQRIFAVGRLRLRLREPAFHDPVRLMLGDKRFLRASAQPVGGGPVGMRLQKGREALEAGFMRMQLEPDPARGRVGEIGL